MAELQDLFNRYGTDKDRNGYTPMYHSILKNIKDRPMNLLEIGIGTMIPGVCSSMQGWALPGYAPGGSLRAWQDYLPNSQIWGIDVQPDTQFTDKRIKTFLLNSMNSTEVDNFVRNNKVQFDVIIDDGNHHERAQLETFRNFYPHVKSGGFYIIEDVTPGSKILTEYQDELKGIASNALMWTTDKKNFVVFSLF